MHHSIDRIVHNTSLCYTSCGALAGMRNCLMDPPRRIDPTINSTMSKMERIQKITKKHLPDLHYDRMYSVENG